MVDRNGTSYFTGYNRTDDYVGPRLYAVNPNGTEKWHKDGNWNFPRTSPALAPDGTLYVWGDYGDASLYALNPGNGSVKWQVYFGEGAGSVYNASPIVGPDGTVYAHKGNNELVALSSANGMVKWQKKDSSYSGPVALSPDGAYLYCGYTVCVSTATGEKVWTANVPGGLNWVAVAPDGTVYASGFYSTSLVAIDPATGNQLWLYDLESNGGVPTIVGDTIYLFCRNATLHAVNRLTGQRIWVFDQLPDDMGTEEQVTHAPVVDKNGIIYLASRSRGVWALRPDKTVLWNYQPQPGQGGGSLAIIGPQDRLYYYSHYNLTALGLNYCPGIFSLLLE